MVMANFTADHNGAGTQQLLTDNHDEIILYAFKFADDENNVARQGTREAEYSISQLMDDVFTSDPGLHPLRRTIRR